MVDNADSTACHPVSMCAGMPDMIAKRTGLSSEDCKSTCWVISDGAAGNERQALALAQALELPPRIVRLSVAQPWAAFAPRLTWAASQALRDQDARPIVPPWPDIAIGCGRRAALLTRCLRGWSKGRCFTVQILDPRVSPSLFDAVVAPRHDRLSASNLIKTVGSLNEIDDAWLAAERARFAKLGDLPAPRTAVLIGASKSAQTLDDAYFEALHRELAKHFEKHGGSFMVSTSRRTPTDRIADLRRQFAAWPGVFWAGPDDGENPYPGILAWADRIIVTADSVNMISEACATGKPVHAFAPRPLHGKLGEFHAALTFSGHLSPLDGGKHAPAPALREMTEVVRRIQLLRQRSEPPAR
jgi:mitochondrial fission protein ELM1